VMVTITDRLGATATTMSTATVADAPLTATGIPLIAATGVPLANVAVATLTDADPNGTVSDYTATINWGDGTTSVGTVTAGANGTFSVFGSHTYSSQGTFMANVSITDVNPAGDVPSSMASATSIVSVAQAVTTTTTLTVSPSGTTVSGQPVTLTAT